MLKFETQISKLERIENPLFFNLGKQEIDLTTNLPNEEELIMKK